MASNIHKTLLVFIAILALVAAEEWYQQGHQALLTWQNFDSSISKPNIYKFVKFFTRNCRYCRMLKQVEEELRKQKQWGLQFYSIDCSIHYDLCMAKATITGFPYVGIYNGKGELAGKIGGYYPVQTMRQALITIQEWHAADQANPSTPIVPKTNTNQQTRTQEKKQTEEKVTQVKETVKTQEKVQTKKSTATSDQDNQGWGESIRDGIRMSVILAGVLLFNKIISPYLKHQQQQSTLGPHIIQIPISSIHKQAAKAQPNQSSPLLSDSL